jgi:hypothetical protein
MGFDIRAEQAAAAVEDEGTVVVILDREGKPYGSDEAPVTITVAGRYSSRYRKAEAAINRRPVRHKKATHETYLDEAKEKVIACTISWAGFVPAEFTRENLTALYEGCPWVLDQVAEAMNDAANFSKPASKTP